MSESTKQLIGEFREPLAMGLLGSVRKFDPEYVRNGTADVYMFTAPHLGMAEGGCDFGQNEPQLGTPSQATC
jgi:hypothetical protein